jgi:hypothetical protein
LDSPNFVVIPSLGGFIEGWLLVVPRRHDLNLRQLPAEYRSEFDRLVQRTHNRLRDLYGPTIAFEHGPRCIGDPAGCTVDHAHLHVVPFGAAIREAVEAEAGGALHLESVRSLFESVPGHDHESYIFLEEPSGERYLGFASNIQSQLVRRVLARSRGRGRNFDWREDLALESVSRTVAAVTPRS